MMSNEDILKETRKQFFAYRNGIIADSLRKNGDPHTMIMGCQITDIAQIASTITPNKEIAEAFWTDTKHRECRMIAPMLYPESEMTEATAIDWAASVECEEIADVLCHRLLRKLPFAEKLFYALQTSDAPLAPYTSMRLLLNLVMLNKVDKNEKLKVMLEQQKENVVPKIRCVIDSILEEFEN
ncbi:MAG: DNA alkylation repair protein [Bacteroidales bacterium]|nr:DNA alkylation repair protein [Bacteroidales bacterium]